MKGREVTVAVAELADPLTRFRFENLSTPHL